jgi:hypothetical protein
MKVAIGYREATVKMSRSDGTRLVLTPEQVGLREQSLPLERAKSSREPPKSPTERFNEQDGHACALIPGGARPGHCFRRPREKLERMSGVERSSIFHAAEAGREGAASGARVGRAPADKRMANRVTPETSGEQKETSRTKKSALCRLKSDNAVYRGNFF